MRKKYLEREHRKEKLKDTIILEKHEPHIERMNLFTIIAEKLAKKYIMKIKN